MNGFQNGLAMIGFISALLLAGCQHIGMEPDRVYETAIRHYMNNWQPLPDTLVVRVDRDHPSDPLLNRLSDLDITIITRETANKLTESDGQDRFIAYLSVRTLRREGFRSVSVVVSSSRSPYDAHGIEYRIERKDGEWVVTGEGVEWMT